MPAGCVRRVGQSARAPRLCWRRFGAPATTRLDLVLRYSPVWGGAIYRVWQDGYHRQALWSEHRLSNALYALARLPVEVGLAHAPGDWPWLWIGGGERWP